jgi:hypothetical protein
MNRTALLLVSATTVLTLSGCDPDVTGVFSDTSSASSTGGAGGDGGAPAGGSGGAATGGGGATTSTTTGVTTTTTTGGDCDPSNPSGDQDKDGFTPAEGDCDDCDAEINPAAIEVAGGGDEDCDSTTNNVPAPCDEVIALDTNSAVEAVKAIDLCKQLVNEKDWGIYAATWVMPDATPVPAASEQNYHLGHGVLPDFGPQVPPRAGKRLLALSSGTARTPEDPGYQSGGSYSKGYASAHAPGFPKETAVCGVSTGSANDAAVLNVGIRVPTNARGFSYDFSFYAHDFPAFVCTTYNDSFFTIFEPLLAGQPDGNIAYDELGNPVTLNGANFRACACDGGPPCGAGGKMYTCPLGDLPLLGTGFESRGATGWLTTTVPVEPGTNISLRWGVYDATDGIGDVTVILDNWRWITTPGVAYGTAVSP